MPEITKYLTINQSDQKKSLKNVMHFAYFLCQKSKQKKEAELF
jgi:hypothetical protein